MEEGSNCVIANLKAQIGQMRKALREALEQRSGAPVSYTEVDSWLNGKLPGCRNLNRNGADFHKSADGPRDIDANLETTHQGDTAEYLEKARQGETLDVTENLDKSSKFARGAQGRGRRRCRRR